MWTNDFNVMIASPADRNDLVAELCLGLDTWGEVYLTDTTWVVELHPSDTERDLSCARILETIRKARARLTQMGSPVAISDAAADVPVMKDHQSVHVHDERIGGRARFKPDRTPPPCATADCPRH